MTTATANPRHDRIRQGIRVAVAINLRRAMGADSVLLTTDEDTSCPYLVVHRSTSHEGHWQLSWLDRDMRPAGHGVFNSRESAICSASGKRLGPEPPQGSRHYRVVKTVHVVDGFTVTTKTYDDTP